MFLALGLLFLRLDGTGTLVDRGGGGGGGGGSGTPMGNLKDLLFFSRILIIVSSLSMIRFLLLEVTPFVLAFLQREIPRRVYST